LPPDVIFTLNFGCGSATDPIKRSPDLAGFRGPTSKGRYGRTGKGRGRQGERGGQIKEGRG